MVEQVIIPDENRFEQLKEKFRASGSSKIHVLSDFDRTITYGLDDGKRTPTVISQLRSDESYLGKDYTTEAHNLFNQYHPIEIDSNVPLLEKKKAMHDWWVKHFDLIAQVGFSKDLIQRVVSERPLQFREGSKTLIEVLSKNNIPLIFMSAAPGDMLLEYLKKDNLLLPNVYVISNLYEWDNEGNAVKIKEPIVTSVNKDETLIRNLPLYDKIKDRKNVILLGDGLEDVGMVEGFDYDNLIKIGFLNENVDNHLPFFKKAYDIILLGDPDMSYVNKLMGDIL